MTIQTIYRTSHSSVWSTEQEALVADALEDSGVYLESYKLKDIVAAITNKLAVFPVIDVETAEIINEEPEA